MCFLGFILFFQIELKYSVLKPQIELHINNGILATINVQSRFFGIFQKNPFEPLRL